MEYLKDMQLLYFGEIHEKIKIFNLVIDTYSCLKGEHVDNDKVQFKVYENGLSVFNAESMFEIPFKGKCK